MWNSALGERGKRQKNEAPTEVPEKGGRGEVVPKKGALRESVPVLGA